MSQTGKKAKKKKINKQNDSSRVKCDYCRFIGNRTPFLSDGKGVMDYRHFIT